MAFTVAKLQVVHDMLARCFNNNILKETLCHLFFMSSAMKCLNGENFALLSEKTYFTGETITIGQSKTILNTFLKVNNLKMKHSFTKNT
jgi:hypothetical protein